MANLDQIEQSRRDPTKVKRRLAVLNNVNERKLVIVCLAVALLLGGALFALLRPCTCPVTAAAYERIEAGMTRAEVESILGGPPGDYRTCPGTRNRLPRIRTRLIPIPPGDYRRRPCLPPRDDDHDVWSGDEGEVHVWSCSGTVVDAIFFDSNPDDIGPVALATWRLGRLKEHFFP
jgi:hypothetical protein